MDLEAQAMQAFDATEAKNSDATADDATQDDAVADAPVQDGQKVSDDTTDEQKEQNTDDKADDDNTDDQKVEEKSKDEPVDDTKDDSDTEVADNRPAFNPEDSLETFVYEGLESITVIGKDGKEYDVKVPEELPDDFEFRTVKEEKLFDQAMIRQSANAEKLVGSYNEQQQVATQQSYNNTLRSEIDAAIESGRIPKFDGKAINPNGKGEQRAQAVLDYMNELNNDLAKAGKTYRVQSFEHALTLLEANEAKEKLAEYQKQINEGKKSVASMSPSSGQDGAGEQPKPKTMPRNMSATDFVSMLDSQGEI
jgi:hypothetical protein